MNTFEKESIDQTKASHDPSTPPNLIAFMLKDWKATKRVCPEIKHLKYFRARRNKLSAQFPGEILVVPTGHQKVRSNDTYYPFRPNSDFFYLTGNVEPDCVLVLFPEEKNHRDTLFVEPNPGKSDPTFFTDRVKGELWVGPRLGVEESKKRFGVTECRSLNDLPQFIEKALLAARKPIRVLRGVSQSIDDQISIKNSESHPLDREFATALSEMRLLKDEQELRELSTVIAATKRGFEDVIQRMRTAKSEREVEGVFYTRARMEGQDVGYGTIAAAGDHACTLHWTQNDGKLKRGDLMLLDAGIEGHSLYTADITRTLPLSGKFSKEQREIYELVLAAQKAAFKEVKPGNDFLEPNRAAMRVLAEGLERLGILKVSAAEALKEENQFYRRYSLHNVSHMLGLDVHDCAQARQEVYKFGKLQPGMVLTVEPGLYFQRDDLTVPARYRGIGVRIEDDVVVTTKGMKNLSANIPTASVEVERWIKSIWSKKK